jgi:cytochrome c oxidase subunit III
MFAMGQVLPYRAPRDRSETTAFLGMVLFLASWAMMFAALFFAYSIVRVKAPAWPPPGVLEVPPFWPSVNTAVIVLSSVALQMGIFWTRRGKTQRLAPSLVVATVLGVGFLALQVMLWTQMMAQGLLPTQGTYPSVFYGLTWFHGLHVLVGVLALGRITVKAFFGAYSAGKHLPVRLWAMYWHFVGVVWAILFVSVFLV